MQEVFIVYGRKIWNEAIFDHDGNYFRESEIFGVFETYENALLEFKNCIKEAHDFFVDYAPWCLAEELVERAAKANPFEDYNLGREDEYDEGDVQWEYIENKNWAIWQMYPVNIDTTFNDCPILAGIHLIKKEIK